MHTILSDFIYWLNSDILSFCNGITIPQKSLFLYTFSWDWSLFSIIKEWRHFKQKKSLLLKITLKLFSVTMQIIFLLQDKAILLFLHSESLIELFSFHWLSYVLKYKLERISFSLIYKISRLIVGLFFSNAFQSSIFNG